MLKSLKTRAATGLALMAGTTASFAADYTALTGAVDFADVVTAVVGVAGSIAIVYVAWKGAKIILSAVRGA